MTACSCYHELICLPRVGFISQGGNIVLHPLNFYIIKSPYLFGAGYILFILFYLCHMTMCWCFHELIVYKSSFYFSRRYCSVTSPLLLHIIVPRVLLHFPRYLDTSYCTYFFLRDISHGRVLMYHEFISLSTVVFVFQEGGSTVALSSLLIHGTYLIIFLIIIRF